MSRKGFLRVGGSALAGAALLGTGALAGCGGSGGQDNSGATEFTFSFGPDNSGSLIAAIGLALGAVWEIAEWLYDHFIAKPEVILPKTDTIVDMMLDAVGALVAGTVRVWMLKK